MISSHDNEYKVIADLTSDVDPLTAEALSTKWSKKHPKGVCQILPLREVIDDSVTLTSRQIPPDAKVKIDVMVHSFPGSEECTFLHKTSNGNTQKHIMRYEQLAEMLSRLIGNHDNVVINLISCSAAKGDKNLSNAADDPNNSFAVKLQRHLSQLQNKDRKVIARTQMIAVATNKYSSEYGRKIGFRQDILHDQQMYLKQKGDTITGQDNKQPGTKVEISQGLVVDSYSKSWKEKVLSELDTLYKATEVPQKKTLLQSWLTEFPNKEPDEILTTMSEEVYKTNSILAINSAGILNLFGYTSGIHGKVKDLVKDGEKYVPNKYPTKHI